MGPRAAAACVAGGLLTATVLTASLWAATATKPLPAEVYVKSDKGPATALRGSLVRYDDDGFTLHVGNDDKTLAWTAVTPATAFALRQKTLDRNSADDNLTLGAFGWSIGAKDPAKAALRAAVRLDASLKDKADDILATPAGAALTAPPATKPTSELIGTGTRDASVGAAAAGPTPADHPPVTGKTDPNTAEKFHTATPAEIAAAMARAHEQADGVQAKIGVKLASFETDHFLVFTDWDAQEYDFLKQNLEGAYRVVATQFEADPKANVFVGKLPVYMLAQHRAFLEFAREIDEWPAVTNNVAGYYMGNNAGFGHMAMWKPTREMTGTSSLDEARRLWAYVLTHEFTHAFLARYKSNVYVTRWLNEGIAEVIASSQFPKPDRHRMARMMALNAGDLQFLFDDANFPTGEYYPVMQSMVEMLVAGDRGSFLKLIDAIKDGTPPEQALLQIYHVNYRAFADKWRQWAKTRPDNG